MDVAPETTKESIAPTGDAKPGASDAKPDAAKLDAGDAKPDASDAKLQASAANLLLEHIGTLGPLLEQVDQVVNQYTPQVMTLAAKTRVAIAELEKSLPPEASHILGGFFMTFFGGSFTALISTAEAFRLSGVERTQRCIDSLADSWHRVAEESARDDEIDDDGDGIADVEQITPAQLLRRKVGLTLHALDPDEVSEAMKGLYAGSIAVLATLKNRFAKAITLGNGIGDVLHGHLNAQLVPLVQAAAEEHRVWVQGALRYLCKFAGVALAWMVQRVVSAFHSATRGSQVLTAALLQFFVRKKMFASHLDKDGDGQPDIQPGTPVFQHMSALVAACGLFFQLRYRMGVPFPLNVPLFPLLCAEKMLQYVVSM